MWRLAEDTITTEDVDALADWLRTYPRLTQGPLVAEFEAAWSEWLGVEHSVMVSSGTTANFAMVAVAGRCLENPHPRVGVAAVTWATNVSPSLLLGQQVQVFDVDRRTMGVDEERVVEAMDRGKLDILFITHLLGFNALTEAIVEAAERNNVLLLEDGCESHGAFHGDRRIGSIGQASSFSFYFGHHMSTIEGGMISTNDAEFADQLRLMRSHGLARESANFSRYASEYPDIDERFLFLSPGLNFRSTDLNAFLGLRQLETLDGRIAVRNSNMQRFMGAAPEYLWTDFATDGMSSFAIPLIAETRDGFESVSAVVEELGIEARPVVAGNLIRQPFISGYPVTIDQGNAPVADHIHDFGMYVGNGPHVTADMIDTLAIRLATEQP